MNERQAKILSAVIEEYTKTAVPVGSKFLSDKHFVDVSSATIRNDMAHLEDEGYLQQMHISSGRVPTDKGYRYFVEEIMGDRQLSKKDQNKLQAELLKMQAKNNRLSRTTAKLLSALSGNMAVSGIIGKDEFSDFGMSELLEQPEFQKMDDVCRLAEALDYVDEFFDKLSAEMKDGETKIFIGKENPIGEISNCSMIVSPYKSKEGERGILAIIGPKRMKYAKNKSLIEYVKKMLSGTMVIVLFINII
jgi:transcriptional regulator of heat shock response